MAVGRLTLIQLIRTHVEVRSIVIGGFHLALRINALGRAERPGAGREPRPACRDLPPTGAQIDPRLWKPAPDRVKTQRVIW